MKIRPKKSVIGTAQCHCCKREIPVKQSETGTLDMSCQWCDLPMYAKKGTEAHKLLLERVTLFEAGPVVEPVASTPSPVPAPERAPSRAVRSVFDIMAGRAE